MTAIGRCLVIINLMCLFCETRLVTTSISSSSKLEEQVQANGTRCDVDGQLPTSPLFFDSSEPCSRTYNARATENVDHSCNVKRVRRTSERKLKKSRQERGYNVQKSQPRKLCPTKTTYGIKSTAEDMYGEKVTVHPYINIGNLHEDQLFYESFCDVERCQCDGVDNKYFQSFCQTTFSLSYGRIIKGGKTGWSMIKLRSGCVCVVRQKKKGFVRRNGNK
ncbi:venom nerve growth factor-like [Ruditapes philippinarum]|uniref:venom nerve growth factor-like n=1 Tax=Ruditapes philippinarum TaxID=129788 RepID=UPI00295C37E3|nr:venom nerve growth factor-like [Ruditapes philippinarum]